MKNNMKNFFDYDHTFRSRRSSLLLLDTTLGILLISFFSIAWYRNFLSDWRAIVVLFILAILFTLGCVVTWMQAKILSIGLNEHGIYLRDRGMIFWNEMKDVSVLKSNHNGHDQQFIVIELFATNDEKNRAPIKIAVDSLSASLANLILRLKKYGDEKSKNEG